MTTKKPNSEELELRRKVKKQEAAKRKKEREEAPKDAPKMKIITGDEGDKKMSFDQWWMVINRKVSMKSWMKEIVLADFKARGLSRSETEDKYNEALKLFGMKW